MTAPRVSPILAHNLLIQGELLQVARTLDAARIPFVTLKGVPFLHRAYERLDARWVTDNDILVRRRDMERTLDALHRLGYAPAAGMSLEAALNLDARYVVRRQHHGRTLSVDLHSSPSMPRIHDLPEDMVWAHCEPFELHGRRLRVLSPGFSLLHLVAHCEQHRFCMPRILHDVAAAWNRWGPTLPRDQLLALSKETGLDHTMEYVLGAADDLGMLRVPPPRPGSTRARLLTRLLPPRRLLTTAPDGTAACYWRGASSLVLRDSRSVLAQLRNDWLPTLDRMSIIYEKPKSRSLYAHYLTRPFRPVARLLGWTPKARRPLSSVLDNEGPR